MKYLIRLIALICLSPLVFAVEPKTFNWTPPTQNTDGTALTDAEISSYNIFCNAVLLSNVINTGGTDTFTSAPLPAGSYVCHATTIASNGEESAASNTVNFTVAQSVPQPPTGFTVTLP